MPKKMGRPPKPRRDVRMRRVTVRLLEAEYRALMRYAYTRGEGMADVMRAAALAVLGR